MPKFNAPPPNGESRKMIEQRAREATRPAVPEKKGAWPFCVNKEPFAIHAKASTAVDGPQKKTPD